MFVNGSTASECAEVTLQTRLRVGGNDRHEQRAFAYSPADQLIPGVPAAQLAMIEPDLEAGLAQCIADARRGLGVLRGVAQENHFR
jgi:hypothetical protein